MPSRNPLQRFEDILENVLRIEQFTAGLDSSTFARDLRTSYAVERCLERISEAAKKLGTAAEDLCPGVPWAKLRGLGNLLRHEYDAVDVQRVWLMVTDDLGSLKVSVQEVVSKLRDRSLESN